MLKGSLQQHGGILDVPASKLAGSFIMCFHTSDSSGYPSHIQKKIFLKLLSSCANDQSKPEIPSPLRAQFPLELFFSECHCNCFSSRPIVFPERN